MESTLTDRITYFLNNHYWKIAEILIKNNFEFEDETRPTLEHWLWQMTSNSNKIVRTDKEGSLLTEEWQQSWFSTRLLHYLQSSQKNASNRLESTLLLKRKDLLFQSIVNNMELTNIHDIKDLTHLYDQILHGELINQTVPKLDKKTHHALCNSLISSPGTTVALLNLLQCDYIPFKNTQLQIAHVFKDSIEQIFHKLNQDGNNFNDLNSLFSIIVLMPDIDDETNEKICKKLQSLSCNDELPLTQLLNIVSCCKCPKVFQTLVVLYDKQLLRTTKTIISQDISKLQQIYQNLINENGNIIINEVFARIVKGQSHWVEDIVGLCSQLALSGDLQKLHVCMANPLCADLWPLIVIYLWNHSAIHLKILDLICPILDMCKLSYPNLFSKLYEVLKKLKMIIDWLHTQGQTNLPDLNAMLSLTKNHSTLYVLKATADITKLEPTKLQSFISEINAVANHNVNCEWDLQIFNGFIVLFSAFNIILQAVELDKELRNIGKEDDSAYEELEKRYNENVKKKLQSLEHNIAELQPLDFRLEMLENLFSLLFLRYEDIQEESFSDSGPEEEENSAYLTRSLTQTMTSTEFPTTSLLTSSSFPPTKTIPKIDRRKITISSTQKRMSSKGVKVEEVTQGFLCSAWLLEDLISTIFISLPTEDLIDQEYSRVTRLKKVINDAKWRLNLLNNAGVCSREKYKNKEKHESVWVYQGGESSESEEEVLHHSPTPRSLSRKLRRLNSLEKTSESSKRANSAKTKRIKYNTGSRLSALKSSCGVIDLMLASPSSLICFFLANGDTTSSEQVIKRFHMQDDPLHTEITFLKAFNQLKEKLKEIKLKHSYHQKETTLQVINDVASAGVFATSIASLLQNFFSTTQLPSDSVGLEGFIVLDLALTMNLSPEHSKCLLNLASSYFSGSSSTYPAIFEDFQNRLHQIIMAVDDMTIPKLLSDPMLPLHDQQAVKDIYTFWEVLSKSLTAFSASLGSSDLQAPYSNYLLLAVCASNSKGVIKTLIKENEPHNYLSQLLVYVSQLSQLVSLNISTKEESGEDVLKETFLHPTLQYGTNFGLLKMDLGELVGHLVFDCGIDPVDLEPTMKCLGIDLVHYLAKNCTPVFPVVKHCNTPPLIVLNSQQNDLVRSATSEIHPYILTSLLLDSLLKALEGNNIFDDNVDKHQLRNNPAIQKVFNEASCLMDVDLQLLTSEDQNLAFLVNLTNLIWLHGLILLETEEDGFGLTSSSFTLREIASSSVGYCIGGVGFVSLLQLWATLLPAPLFAYNRIVTIFPVNIQVSTDPRVLFALCHPYRLTPKVQVITADLLDSQLEHCMQEYVQNSTTITDSALHLPALLYRYIDYLIISQSPEGDDGSDTASNSSFERCHIFSEFLKDNLLLQVDITGKNIEIMKDFGFSICLNYSDHRNTKTEAAENRTSWKDRALNQSVMQFLAKRSPLLGLLIEQLHSIEEAEETGITKTSSSAFESYLNSETVTKLSELYGHSQIMAALQTVVPEQNLWSWFDASVVSKDWASILQMLNLIPEYQLKMDSRLMNFKDDVLTQLASQPDGWIYCQCIERDLKMAKCALANLENWPGDGCEEVLQTLLSTHSSLSDEIKTKGQEMLTAITLCQKIVKVSTIGSWKAVYESDPWCILELLLDSSNISIALEWANYNNIPQGEQTSTCLFLVRCFVLGLFENGFETAGVSILSHVEIDQAVQICEYIVNNATSLSSLQHAASFMIQTEGLTPSQCQRYNLLDIGVHMLALLPWQDQEWYRKLISQPELFVEQLLMNTRISTLETILLSLGSRLLNLDPGSSISPPCLDALLRRYASKALDISIRTKSLPTNKTRPACQAISKDKFTPPENAPTKQEWIPNDDVTECMCCRITVFSMFNRRHHCRRCGRVVCASCSSHRIKVAGYGNVAVRVCNDCLEYITPKTLQVGMIHGCCQWSSNCQGKFSAVEKDSCEPEWLLSWDLVYNSTIREEFTYAHAPSVSLCMSILKLHFEPTALLRFLVTTIEDMVQLLRPTNPGVLNPEVDYIFLVRMIRSLVEFTRLCSSRQGVPSYGAQIEQIIAEVNLLDLLISSHEGCVLLPCKPLRGHVMLRQLRENLLEHELFTLALEVSAKVGLDYGSVWSAWGKACLKAGAWNEAREKFTQCNLQKKDIQHSAILTDILQLLQNNPHSTDLKTRLSHLQNIAMGKPLCHQSSSRLDPCVLEECLYYLKTYGNHGQLLQFYMDQQNLSAAISFVLESSVDPQVFLDSLFLPCLRSGLMMQVYEQMATTDKSLYIWKAYIRVICAYFERHKMYNVLYETQIWMKDHIRAAMTCTHFYTNGARSYSDLGSNLKHLDSASVHLYAAQKSLQATDTAIELVMHLRKEEITRHLSTIKLQCEVTRFLANNCLDTYNTSSPPTLFGNNEQRSRVAILVLISGEYLDQSLLLVNRIIEEWNLEKSPIFSQAAAKFVENGRPGDVRKLVSMLENEEELCNDIIMAALCKKPLQPDSLISLINDVPTKITAFIECGQLKSAYLLAVKWDRLDDITRVLHAAEQLNQPLIRKICLKRLGQAEY